MSKQLLYNKWVDGIFILSPPFISLLIVALLPDEFKYTAAMPLSAWVLLVLMIDVAHVYSTLFRTYFDNETFVEQKALMRTIPFVSLLVAVLIYSLSDMLFWSLLAYLAVYHFIRQQYGFMRLYSRNDRQNHRFRIIDAVTIYSATIYPVIYWHLNPERNFNWFVEGDFLQMEFPILADILFVVYVLILCVYLIKESFISVKSRTLNIPKNLVVLGTAFSWFFGIVYFNGDLAFTLLNVVAHGIPYMALVWIWGKKKSVKGGFENNRFQKAIFTGAGIFIFLGLILAFAFVEEGLWDSFVWREHKKTFGVFNSVIPEAGSDLLKIIVPLLALPQIVHYVIDGYIWKIKNDRQDWSKHVLK